MRIKKYNNFIKESDNTFSDLTIDSMIDQFPISDDVIMKIANDLVEGRDAKVNDIYLNTNSRIYSSFAQLQKTLVIDLYDVGQSDVTPGGTYHSKRGIGLQFHFRGYWNDKGKIEFTMNASKNTPGGMATYRSVDINGESSIKNYMYSVLRYNSPNDITDMVY